MLSTDTRTRLNHRSRKFKLVVAASTEDSTKRVPEAAMDRVDPPNDVRHNPSILLCIVEMELNLDAAKFSIAARLEQHARNSNAMIMIMSTSKIISAVIINIMISLYNQPLLIR